MAITATNVLTLPPVNKMFISVDEEWFQRYVTYALGTLSDCYLEHVLDNDHVSQLGVPTQSVKAILMKSRSSLIDGKKSKQGRKRYVMLFYVERYCRNKRKPYLVFKLIIATNTASYCACEIIAVPDGIELKEK